MEKKWEIIDEIIAAELDMFLKVRASNADENRCQEDPKTFKLMRWMSHSVLSLETLESYRDDLMEAKEQGRNMMTEKYALMDNLLPHPEEGKELIDNIASHEIDWIRELKDKYPTVIQDNIPQFVNYMICEYETYSVKTLKLLDADVKKAADKKKNLTEMRYNNLFKRLGYSSIADACEKNFN